MNVLSIARVVASPKKGWGNLEKAHPSLFKLFITFIFPLSLLPAAMLFYAGTHYGNEFVAGFSRKPWGSIAVAVFLTEVLFMLLMGWLVRQVTNLYQVRLSVRHAYLIAGIAPIPLWLSSLGLLMPSLLFNVSLAFLALAICCSLVYHGVYALSHMHEGVLAAAITQTVMGAGLIIWALLLLVIVSL